jgi:hypothetical protein
VSQYRQWFADFLTQTINSGTQSVSYMAACPAGSRALGGGSEVIGGSGAQLNVIVSAPYENTSSGWRVVLRNNSAANVTTTVRVHVVCAVAQ